MRLHAYCLTCGRVKTMQRPTAKRLGFYLTDLTSLKACLERRSDYAKMTQSQSRLMTSPGRAAPLLRNLIPEESRYDPATGRGPSDVMPHVSWTSL